jgi:hypothetical protein
MPVSVFVPLMLESFNLGTDHITNRGETDVAQTLA